MLIDLDSKLHNENQKKLNEVLKNLKYKNSVFFELMGKWLEELRSELVLNIVGKRYFKTHPTGNLANSFFTSVNTYEEGIIEGELFSNSPYAGIQEEGGDIKAKNVTYLTIPLPAVKTKAGKTRGGARSFKNTFVKKSKKGNLIIFQNKGKDIIPLFLLRKKVTLKGKHYISDTVGNYKDFTSFVELNLNLSV